MSIVDASRKVRRASPTFIGAVCFAAGLLLAAVIIPARQTTNRVAAGSGSASATQRNEPGASGDASAVAGGSGAEPASANTSGGSPDAIGGAVDSAAAADQGPVRGVTADTIKIGVAYNVTPQALTFSQKFNSGDGQAQFNAILAGWRDSGQLPVNGRNLQFVYRPLDISSPEQQRSACVALIQDEQVFAVISTQLSQSFNDCVSREFQTPILTIELESQASFQKSAPYLFSLQMTVDSAYSNLVGWANSTGQLSGHKIGIYTSADQQFAEAADILRGDLERAGVRPAADVTAPAGGTGLASTTDSVAVQQFRTAGVDVAFILTNRTGFTQLADAQGYKPHYLEADPYAATNDVQTGLGGPNTYDGAQARTSFRFGEGPAGMPEPPESSACYDQYNRFAGKDVHRPGANGVSSAEQYQVPYTCDLANALLAALKGAGPNLSVNSYIAALETIQAMPMAILADVSFSSNDHAGTHTTRQLTWTKACSCWTASGAFEPLYG